VTIRERHCRNPTRWGSGFGLVLAVVVNPVPVRADESISALSSDCHSEQYCAHVGRFVEVTVSSSSPVAEPLGAYCLGLTHDATLLRLATVTVPGAGPFSAIPVEFCENTPGVFTIVEVSPGAAADADAVADLVQRTFNVVAANDSETTVAVSSARLPGTNRSLLPAFRIG
jgi:hypothetical protein